MPRLLVFAFLRPSRAVVRGPTSDFPISPFRYGPPAFSLSASPSGLCWKVPKVRVTFARSPQPRGPDRRHCRRSAQCHPPRRRQLVCRLWLQSYLICSNEKRRQPEGCRRMRGMAGGRPLWEQRPDRFDAIESVRCSRVNKIPRCSRPDVGSDQPQSDLGPDRG